MAIYINENLPNGIQNLPKSVQDFPKYLINPQKDAQDFEDFAKMAKFRQIWSHWRGDVSQVKGIMNVLKKKSTPFVGVGVVVVVIGIIFQLEWEGGWKEEDDDDDAILKKWFKLVQNFWLKTVRDEHKTTLLSFHQTDLSF